MRNSAKILILCCWLSAIGLGAENSLLPPGAQLRLNPDGNLFAVDSQGNPLDLNSEQVEELNRLVQENPPVGSGGPGSGESGKEKPPRDRISADGSQMLTEEEYQREQAQLRNDRRRQQLQDNIQKQLQSSMGGGGGGRSGGGGGGGGGSGGGSSGGSNRSMKPVEMSAFGTPPDFTKGNQNLEKLILESQKPDPTSEKFLEDIRKQVETASRPDESKQLAQQAIPDFSKVLNELLSSLSNIPAQTTAPQKLVENSSLVRKRRPALGRPLKVPRGLGLVSGQSDATFTKINRQWIGGGTASGSMPEDRNALMLPARSPASSSFRSFKSSTH